MVNRGRLMRRRSALLQRTMQGVIKDAESSSIILRRIGSALLIRQFTLRVPEFAIYRLYIESLPFLVAVVESSSAT